MCTGSATDNTEKIRQELREIKHKYGVELKIEEWDHREAGVTYQLFKAVITSKVKQ